MNILVIDDERLPLLDIIKTIEEVEPTAHIYGFRKAKEGLEFAQNTPCDIAFLDIDMRGMNGIELAKKIKRINPSINIIFVTGYSQYAGDAMSMRASGYVMKPATTMNIKEEMNNLRNPITRVTKKKIRVQTFGNFEVFADEVPIRFQYDKTKELLAYLIDRNGALCPNGEIIGILWEDEADAAQKMPYFKRIRADLSDVLIQHGQEDILVKQRGKIGIVPGKIECDYYDWLLGKPYAINMYRGEYMTQYSWGESSLGEIEAEKSELIQATKH